MDFDKTVAASAVCVCVLDEEHGSTLQRGESSSRACSDIGGASSLQLLSDLLLYVVEFRNTSVNAHTFSLVQVGFGVSRTNAFGVT